jgi:hypothetical protein
MAEAGRVPGHESADVGFARAFWREGESKGVAQQTSVGVPADFRGVSIETV